MKEGLASCRQIAALLLTSSPPSPHLPLIFSSPSPHLLLTFSPPSPHPLLFTSSLPFLHLLLNFLLPPQITLLSLHPPSQLPLLLLSTDPPTKINLLFNTLTLLFFFLLIAAWQFTRQNLISLRQNMLRDAGIQINGGGNCEVQHEERSSKTVVPHRNKDGQTNV